MPIDPKLVQWDTPAIDPAAVKWDDEVTLGTKVANVARDVAAGAVRGAGSIGATLLAPVDAAARALGVQNDFIGRDDRRTSMDAGLQTLGADPNSAAYTVGKVGGEVAGTAGVGGVLANAARAAGAATPVVQALATSGLRAGGATGLPGLALRTAAGAATGGASASLVDPDQAGTGVVIGAALPGALKGAGALGKSVERTIHGPSIPPTIADAVRNARTAGYVIPPTQAKPTLANRVIEGLAGKLTTAQNASARNQPISNDLARRAIGADELTTEAIQAVRDRANRAYDALASVGQFQADDAYRSAVLAAGGGKALPGIVNRDVDDLVTVLSGQSTLDAQQTIESLKRLRFEGSGNKVSPDPTKKALGRAQTKIAQALEGLIERNLDEAGQPELLTQFRDARTTLAKVFDVERALNPASGNVDAAKFAALLKKGRPLSGELRQVAEFASQFPKAVQMPERMGSLPGLSPLDFGAAGTIGAVTGEPTALAGIFGRPMARAAALSSPVQSRLTTPVGRFFGVPALSDESQDALQLLLARGAPAAVSGP